MSLHATLLHVRRDAEDSSAGYLSIMCGRDTLESRPVEYPRTSRRTFTLDMRRRGPIPSWADDLPLTTAESISRATWRSVRFQERKTKSIWARLACAGLA